MRCIVAAVCRIFVYSYALHSPWFCGGGPLQALPKLYSVSLN